MRMEEGRRLAHQPELSLGSATASPGPTTAAPDWQLDEGTCRVGRAGVAAARAMLRDRAVHSRPGSSPASPGAVHGHEREDVAA